MFSVLRTRQWWKPKAANLLAVLYAVILITRLPAGRAVLLMIPAVITILGIGGFGHVVNDYFDIDIDTRAQKTNALRGMARWKLASLVLSLLLAALLPWLALPFDTFSIALLLTEFALLVAYAAPPLRLKERGIWPMFSDAAYAYALPSLLAAHTFFLASNQFAKVAVLTALFFWQFALGARHYLNHIALDRINDVATGVSTLATTQGNRFLHSLIRHIVLPLEVLSFAVYVALLSRSVAGLGLVVAGVFVLTSFFQLILMLGRGYPLFTYRFSKSHLDWLYQDAFPLTLLLYLCLANQFFIALLLVHLVLFYGKGVLLLTAPLWPAFALVQPLISRSEAKRPNARKNRPQISIAVANINKGKYTETFVHGSVARLKYDVQYLHGGELPMYDADDRHFLSNWPSLQSLSHFLETALELDKNHFLKTSISSYLQAKKVRLILAHFGPVGLEMLPIARDLGIPLVVVFHGYDAFHAETLRQCAEGYQMLFREAARIIGVSRLMLSSLHEMGAPADKLVHLPAFVNLDLFSYSDHSVNPPRMLAVGRFAETKSPHLTILAFERVVRVTPTAHLTMIGKGGGGELFEACLILVQALGLQQNVTFRGVLSHEEVAAEMRQARIFVQHSVRTPENHDMEGKPVAVMEAMACGLPVVATRHSGIAELIEDQVTGILVPEFDVQAMAESMTRLCQDDNLARCIGHKASAAIHDDPLISRHVEILEEIIDSAIARG